MSIQPDTAADPLAGVPQQAATTALTTPVTVLTGFLGAGKTTLLNRILTGDHGRRYAVIVNEFGEIGIDNDLVVDADEEVFEMNNGCICCTVRGDLIRILSGLMKRKGGFDGIIVETTGLADPSPVAQTFYADDEVRQRTRLDAIVTMVDAKHIEAALLDAREAAEQVAFADVLVLNKTDLVTPADLARIEARLRRMNPVARIVRAERAGVALDQVLDVGAFDLGRILEVDPRFLGKAGTPDHDHDHGHSHSHSHGHDHDGHACTADHVHDEHCGHDHHGHDHHGHDHHDHAHDHQDHAPAAGGLDPSRHSDGVESVSFAFDAPLDENKVQDWLGEVSQRLGPDLLRYKGILSIAGNDRRLVFQGVHMILDADWQRDWRADERRWSRAVFIGRNLDREGLKAGFEGCRA
jgi:G3E family GTPase